MTRFRPVALVLIAAMLAPAAAVADGPDAPPPACAPFAMGPEPSHSAALPLVRLCARLVEADARGALSPVEASAASRLGDYLAVLAKLEMRAAREDGGYRITVARRVTGTARYLIADRLGLIDLAERIAPAA